MSPGLGHLLGYRHEEWGKVPNTEPVL